MLLECGCASVLALTNTNRTGCHSLGHLSPQCGHRRCVLTASTLLFPMVAMMDDRDDLAWRITEGVAGYLQYVNASGLLALPGEDTAQFVMCQVLQAQQKFRVVVSQRPPNWTGRERVDAGLLPKAETSTGWYGVVEVKWITDSVQRDNARRTLIEDCARVASVDTSNLNAKLVVVVFTDDMFNAVFDAPHLQGGVAEDQRKFLSKLLMPGVGNSGSESDAEILAVFPSYMARVPSPATFSNGLEAELLARAAIKSGDLDVGHVLAWQVNQRRGRPPGNKSTPSSPVSLPIT